MIVYMVLSVCENKMRERKREERKREGGERERKFILYSRLLVMYFYVFIYVNLFNYIVYIYCYIIKN